MSGMIIDDIDEMRLAMDDLCGALKKELRDLELVTIGAASGLIGLIAGLGIAALVCWWIA